MLFDIICNKWFIVVKVKRPIRLVQWWSLPFISFHFFILRSRTIHFNFDDEAGITVFTRGLAVAFASASSEIVASLNCWAETFLNSGLAGSVNSPYVAHKKQR